MVGRFETAYLFVQGYETLEIGNGFLPAHPTRRVKNASVILPRSDISRKRRFVERFHLVGVGEHLGQPFRPFNCKGFKFPW